MHTTAIMLVLGLAAPLAVTGCSRKSDSAGTPVPATATAAITRCPAGSTGDAINCKASGGARVGRLTWNGTLGDTAQSLTLRNVSGTVLKGGSVTVWFYDKTGRRLDVAGAKKYAVPGDAFGSAVKVAETRTITFPLSRSGVPDGTAQIEAEVTKATLVNPDGTDGPVWQNDDLNSDDRGMVSTVAAGVATAPVATGAVVRPGIRPVPPPPPPAHR
jgi:hypothetical protein